jgi:ketosteroid isomerase-like protein
MSRENVEVVRRGYDAYDRGDIAAALDTFHPEIEWKQLEQPESAFGHEGVLRAWDEWSEPFDDDLRAEVEELIDAGEDVVAVVRHRGTGRQSGVELDMRTYLVYSVRQGRVVRMVEYRQRDEALRAARP